MADAPQNDSSSRVSSFFYFFNDGRIFAILIFLASCFFCFLSEDLERLHDGKESKERSCRALLSLLS